MKPTRVRWLAAALALLLASCGDAPAPIVPAFPAPAWAKVAPEQIAEAKKHGVPVAFENDLGMRFVLIPAGTFLMGSPEDEEGRRAEEIQHEVTISQPFFIAITEVTNGQYQIEDEEPGHSSARPTSRPSRRAEPVGGVTWNEIRRYAERVGKLTGVRAYRLPSEAEWEYACRGGASTAFSWGDDVASGWRHANALDADTAERFTLVVDPWPRDDGYRKAAPVGTYEPNAWGLHDMHGNVWEMCATMYGPYPDGSRNELSVPWKRSSAVIRGGSWATIPPATRSAYRWALPYGKSSPDVGFRLVSPLPEPRR